MAFITPPFSSHPRDVTASTPNEILLEIFKLVAQQRITPPRNNSYEEVAEDLDMEDETLFPYCLANVCQRWYHVMLANPEWWSRVRIQMDQFSLERTLSDFRHVMEMTKKVQPLQIFVGYKCEEFEANPDVERDLVHGIVATIRPHILRYEKIVIQARFGSSLPLISSGAFRGPTPLLRELRLECDSYPVVQSLPKGKGHIHLPLPDVPCTDSSRKMHITLDGPTFLDSCFVPDFWKELFSENKWTYLKISHMKTDTSVNTYNFLNDLFRRDIVHLTLEEVDLPCSDAGSLGPEHQDTALAIQPSVTSRNLTLISMEPTAITPFFADRPLGVLKVDSCPTAGYSYPKAVYLYLQNIADDEEVADTIISVDPSELYISDCPGLSDFTLGSLVGNSKNSGVCHALRVLEIDGRTKVTPGGLKRLIEGRRRISDTYYRSIGIAAEDIPDFMDFDDYEFPADWTEPSPLMTLNISCPGYKVPTEYRKFFEESIHCFEWHAHSSYSVRIC